MKSRLSYYLSVTYLVIGTVVLLCSSLFKNDLSDFALGFCEGVSIMLILGSVVSLICHLKKQKSL